MLIRPAQIITLVLFVAALPVAAVGDDGLQFGFGKSDVTPDVPLRLSGYSNRAEPSEGVDEPLFARAMAMRSGGGGPPAVLVSVDTIGFPGTLTKSIFERLEKQHGISRERFVICCTHSHTTPEVGALSDMFEVPFTQKQKENTRAYAARIADQIVAAAGEAIDDLQPGRMFAGEGEATFAVNRRIIKDGTWAGFGVNPQGPVDHALPFLKITGPDGKTIRGLLFNYACHCTTFGGEYNRVNGDWAGYAARYLEAAHEGATALCTIGTGADANPQRDSDRALELAQAQGQEIADEINGLIDGELTEVTARPTASFGYAGLPIDRPTKQQLEENLTSARRPVRLHAENMLATLDRMGRLPETYPMPIQVWRFGNQFAMVFLGGEVCVDYGLRIKRELGPEEGRGTASAGGADSRLEKPQNERSTGPTENSQPSTLKSQLTPWVSAYTNDVFGYVASERMRPEGGYEVDFSMIYYMLPGRWSSGTEEVILRRVHEMYQNTGKVGPLSAEDAQGTFTLPRGYRLEIAAAEPLIRDPINMALAGDGSLWVVEMGDYPRGKPGADRIPDAQSIRGAERATPWDGPPGGAIKKLTDTDGDGRYDAAVTFLDQLTFPTGVFPWRDGAIISAAPDIFFARDTDNDGRADRREVLFSGFEEANPQHRINGFTPGPDGWLYLASGTNNGTITSARTGQTLDISGRDLRIHPETGRMEALSGRSQYGRTRDDWGHWFGNDNSNPLWQYVIEDRYVSRNPFVAAPSPKVFVTEPPHAPPVYPTSRTLDRFNDLFALNRFTSACAPCIWRAASTDEQLTALVCEPVHNLVSRVILEPDGVTFRGHRHADELHSEFFSSTDNWFRPVRVLEEEGGSLLVCDMYRHVIEHPEWIPEAWQAQLDLYAGNDKGRIYRLIPASQDASNLASALQRPREELRQLTALAVRDGLTSERLIATLHDSHPGIVRWGIEAAEPRLNDDPQLLPVLLRLTDHEDVRVRYQLALSLGESSDPRVAQGLLAIAARDPEDVWIRTAVLSSATPHALAMLETLLNQREEIGNRKALLEGLIATALGEDVEHRGPGIARLIAGSLPNADVAGWQVSALSAYLDALQRRGSTWERMLKSAGGDAAAVEAAVEPIFAVSRETARQAEAATRTRAAALQLLGHEPARRDQDVTFLASLLSPREAPELQAAAVAVLARRADRKLPTLLLSGWKQHAPSLRATIVTTLLSRGNWMEDLVDALAAGDVPPGDLDAAARQRLLTASPGPVREAATRLFGSATENDRSEAVAAYSSVVSLTGDRERGAAVFKKACSVCHQLGGMGKDLGPQLATLQNKSADALVTAILDPNRAVEQKYGGYIVVTGDGRALSGLVKEETGSSLTLAEPNGTEHSILRIDIEQMQSTGKSFMPEGLEKDLSPQDVADVIAFVRTATK